MNQSSRRGLTLIELLVVLSILGLLLALVIPAVMSARESQRRSTCQANLKQIGLALNSYTSAHGAHPGGVCPHAWLLPDLDQVALFQSINFAPVMTISLNNATAAAVNVSVFLCPSDRKEVKPVSQVNLMASRGFERRDGRPSGAFGIDEAVPLAAIRDGLSSTAAFSEVLSGDYPAFGSKRDRLGSVFDMKGVASGPSNLVPFLEKCRGAYASDMPVYFITKGWDWLRLDYGATYYNHNMGPNQEACIANGAVQEGAWTASSYHGAGVNVLFCDGHVRWVREGVNLDVWRALGTRNGGETVSSQEY